MTLFPCSSSKISEYGYDRDSALMCLKFRGCADAFYYSGVSREFFSEFLEAGSKGRFFLSRVKDKFDYTKVGVDGTVEIGLIKMADDIKELAREILALHGDAVPLRGCEVGVWCGELSDALLREASGLQLDMVDTWDSTANKANRLYVETGDDYAVRGAIEVERAHKMALEVAARHAPRAAVIKMASTDYALSVADATYDFVFLDADHSYAGVIADIVHWKPKVKPGGILCGHDYDNPNYPSFGVARAVRERFPNHVIGPQMFWSVRL